MKILSTVVTNLSLHIWLVFTVRVSNCIRPHPGLPLPTAGSPVSGAGRREVLAMELEQRRHAVTGTRP